MTSLMKSNIWLYGRALVIRILFPEEDDLADLTLLHQVYIHSRVVSTGQGYEMGKGQGVPLTARLQGSMLLSYANKAIYCTARYMVMPNRCIQ